MATTGAQLIAFSHAGAVLTYVAMAASPFPMADALLSRADATLGFDWLAWFRFVNERPWLHLILAVAYDSIPVQGFALIGYFSFRNPRRVHEFMLATMLSIIIITPIMVLFPAVGEASHHGIGIPEQWANDIIALRSHTLTMIGTTDGIIFFPSFHTTLGVLFVNMARGRKWLIPVLILNLLLIASVPTQGAHYGADMLSGFAVAFVALAATQFLRSRRGEDATAVARWADAYGLAKHQLSRNSSKKTLVSAVSLETEVP
jgi:PAP2 superfamily protein